MGIVLFVFFHFIPFFPTTPSFSTPLFFPTLYPLIPTPSFPCLYLLPFVSLCYLLHQLLFLPLLHFHFPSHIPFLPLLPFLPHFSNLLSFPPPSIHRPLLLSSVLFLSTSSLSLSFSLLAPSLSLSLPFSLSPSLPLTSHPTERYLSLSFSSLPLFFFPSFHLYPFLIPLPLPSPSFSYFPIPLSPIVVLCSLHSTVIYNST